MHALRLGGDTPFSSRGWLRQASFSKTRTIFDRLLSLLFPLIAAAWIAPCLHQVIHRSVVLHLRGLKGSPPSGCTQLHVALHSLTLRAGSHTSSSVPHAPTHAHEQAHTGAHGCASEHACVCAQHGPADAAPNSRWTADLQWDGTLQGLETRACFP